MIAIELALGILRDLLDLAVDRAKSMTDDQRREHWNKFDARVAPIERLIDKLTARMADV